MSLESKNNIRGKVGRELNEPNLKKAAPVRTSTFVTDTGYRVVPTYQDKDGTSVFYAGPIIEKR